MAPAASHVCTWVSTVRLARSGTCSTHCTAYHPSPTSEALKANSPARGDPASAGWSASAPRPSPLQKTTTADLVESGSPSQSVTRTMTDSSMSVPNT